MRSPRGIFFLVLPFLFPALLSAADNSAAVFLIDAVPATHLNAAGRMPALLDPQDAFYYPWGWSARQYTGATFSHWPGVLEGSSFDFAGSVFAVPRGVVNFSLMRYSAGTETMEEPGGVERTVTLEEDLLVSLGYGRDIAKRWRAGASAKYLTSTLAEDYTGTALFGEAGVMYHSLSGKQAAVLAAKNIGQKITYYRTAEPLPAEVSACFMKDMSGDEQKQVLIAAGYARLLNEGRDSFSAGVRIDPDNLGVAMLGVRWEEKNLFYTLGIEMKARDFVFDIGYQLSTVKLTSSDMPLRFSVSWLRRGSRGSR